MQFQDLPCLPYDVPAAVMHKARQIKLALFDVDGVLTDGTLHYEEHGERVKSFHALDGHGLKMLEAAGITVGVISARQSAALTKRLNDLGIAHQYLGVRNKLQVFNDLLRELTLPADAACFTGDDVIDLEVMQSCGLSFSVRNGHFIAQHFADWVTEQGGGAGAVRAICDVLLYAQQQYPLGSSHQQ